MFWSQKEINLPAKPRGFHLVTDSVVDSLSELKRVRVGLLHVFLTHTSASLCLNENADPTVRADFESWSRTAIAESPSFRHQAEGPDDMPAHLKSSVFGCSVSIPVKDGRLCLGTWQGIYLGEHRTEASSRRLILTLYGATD